MPGMPVKFLTSHMLVCCRLAATRPAAFAASSVLLPASSSAPASGSVADAEAASASQLQVEAFAAAEAAGSASSQDDSAVSPLEDDSVVVLSADDSAEAALGDSAVVLPADDSVVVLRAARGDSAALRVDDSPLPEASASPLQAEPFAAAVAAGSASSRGDSAVGLMADASSQWAALGDSAVALRVDDSPLPEASASPLQAEPFAAAVAAGSASSRGDSAVGLMADASSQWAALGDSAVVLTADDSPRRAALGDSAVGLMADASPQDDWAALQAGGSPVAWQAAERAVPGGQHWARWRDGRWSASPVCREAPP